MLYFAYGSNLSIERLMSRCPKAEVLGRATLTGHKLVFQKNNGGRAVANIVAEKQSTVYGALYHIAQEDVPKLDSAEGHPYVYKRQAVEATFNGRTINCSTYIMPQTRHISELFQGAKRKFYQFSASHRQYALPETSYFQHIVRGYQDFGYSLDLLETVFDLPEYDEPLVVESTTKEVKNVDNSNKESNGTHNVFVYGTLMSGEANNGLIRAGSYFGNGFILGRIFDLPYGYPAVILGDSASLVVGECWTVDDATLSVLDALEGYNPDTDSGMYRRRMVEVQTEHGHSEAMYVYEWSRSMPQGAKQLRSRERWTGKRNRYSH